MKTGYNGLEKKIRQIDPNIDPDHLRAIIILSNSIDCAVIYWDKNHGKMITLQLSNGRLVGVEC